MTHSRDVSSNASCRSLALSSSLIQSFKSVRTFRLKQNVILGEFSSQRLNVLKKLLEKGDRI